jgi:D-psicose/D-tagatose/L-ribulose 3-epimerase
MSIALGINSWVWTSPMSDASAELVYRAKAMGFDAFEVAVEDPAHFAADGAVTRALRETGLKPIVCGAFGPSRDLTHDDERFRRESIAYIRDTLVLAQAWGSKILAGPIYSAVGKRRQLPDAQRQIEWGRAVVGLREAGKIAADAGVTLAVEPLNRFETDLVNTAAQAVRLIDEVGSPAVKIHLDTFHMHIEEKSLLEAIRLLADGRGGGRGEKVPPPPPPPPPPPYPLYPPPPPAAYPPGPPPLPAVASRLAAAAACSLSRCCIDESVSASALSHCSLGRSDSAASLSTSARRKTGPLLV